MSIADELAKKTLEELNSDHTSQPSRSRVWKTPHGYRFMVPWSNLVLLRLLIRKITSALPRSEYRIKN